MTPEEIRTVADDIAVAIRARGQAVADEARRQKMGSGVVNIITDVFNQAADMATLRGLTLSMAAMDSDRKPELRP